MSQLPPLPLARDIFRDESTAACMASAPMQDEVLKGMKIRGCTLETRYETRTDGGLFRLERIVYPWAAAGVAIEGVVCTASPFLATPVAERDPDMVQFEAFDRVEFYEMCETSLRAGPIATGAQYYDVHAAWLHREWTIWGRHLVRVIVRETYEAVVAGEVWRASVRACSPTDCLSHKGLPRGYQRKQIRELPHIWRLVVPHYLTNNQKAARLLVSQWRCEFSLFFRNEAQFEHWSDTETEISESEEEEEEVSDFEQPMQIEQLVDSSDAGDVSMSSTGMGPWSMSSMAE